MMKKKVLRFVAFLCIAAFCLPIAASAAGMTNFIKKISYSATTFTDVPKDAWYAANVGSAYQCGIVGGQGKGLFNPAGNVTIAEAITFAVRINRIYNGLDPVVAPTDKSAWYSGYVSYARESGILTDSFYSYTDSALRIQLAHILAHALPDKEYASINTSVGLIPDVGPSDLYYQDALRLYQAGITTGADVYGNFHPAASISRAEAVAMIARMIEPSLRKSFSLKETLTESEIKSKLSSAVFKIEAVTSTGHSLYIENTSPATVSYYAGSGFFIKPDGTAYVSFEAVDTILSAKVTSSDGKSYTSVSVLGYDHLNNVALIKVDGQGKSFPTLSLADSSNVPLDSPVYSISSTSSKGNKVFPGTVSVYSKSLSGGSLRASEYMQVTPNSPIPGTSNQSHPGSQNTLVTEFTWLDGSPLLNEYGDVIGINALYSPINQITNYLSKAIEIAEQIVPIKPVPLRDFTNEMYQSVAKFDISNVDYTQKQSNTYQTAYVLSNGQTGLFSFSDKNKGYYIKLTVKTPGMLNLIYNSKQPLPKTTAVLPENMPLEGTALFPKSASLDMVDQDDNVLDSPVSAGSIFRQIWISEPGDYVFLFQETPKATSHFTYKLYWYFSK